MIVSKQLILNTRGHGDTVDITKNVAQTVCESALSQGVVTLFVVGSTAALTTIEYEDGVIADLSRALEVMAPRDQDYQHHLRWHDDNGHSHVRAALLGPSLSVPFVDRQLTLGTWQQIILIDFDTQARKRKVMAQIMGEA
jgi:secondary thiamine-phosphate synthase enzyme